MRCQLARRTIFRSVADYVVDKFVLICDPPRRSVRLHDEFWRLGMAWLMLLISTAASLYACGALLIDITNITT